MPKFTHLHTHSHYSLLSALPKITELVAAAKTNGMNALALTDNGNLYGAIEFYKECVKQKIKPIIGIDAYVAVRTRKDRQAGVDNRRTRLILLAKNFNGYKNLLKLVTLSHLEGFYYKPRMDREILEGNSSDLIAISPSFNGEIAVALKNRDTEKARESTNWFTKTFGKENFFIELTRHPEAKDHKKETDVIKDFAETNKVNLVASHDVYYIFPDDRRARDTLLSIQTNADYGEVGRTNEDMLDLSFISEEQAYKLFKNDSAALENNEKISSACNLKIELGNWVFPDFKTAAGRTPDDELRQKVTLGIEKRGLKKTKEIEERMEYELKIIKEKGYTPYFLVVGDLLEYAHTHNILTTIRGSVAGSLVTYLAGITNVNPLEYKLPFERFLNPERPSAPDIDMDFADNRRDEMIAYAKEKYGQDKVAQVGTFGTMLARGSVRDVTRALGYEYAVGDRIAKLIPLGSQGFPMTIDKALEIVPDLKKIYKSEKDARDIIDMAKKIEGCARHISVHAAGVVMAPKPLTEYVPLQYDPKGEEKIITQYDMYAVDEVGLLKFDFLGIKNLSILADSVNLAKKLEGKDIDIENIPLDDKKTFEMLAKGETIGLFQLNGEAMTKFLKELRPTHINDINVMVALYRPGPMKNIPEYIARKHGTKPIVYMHPKMENFLKESYGILVYQEDIMFTALELAGYTWKTVDKLRKAIGKKIPAEMAEQHSVFVEGCIKHSGLTSQKAEQIWGLFEPFQGYGFNKAHAASYGKVAYQTAYMKANFPAIYMSAVLTADSGDVEKIGETIAECKRMNIPVLPPDINESFEGFTVVKVVEKSKPETLILKQTKNTKSEVKKDKTDRIRFGLTTIKNFGEGIAKSIIDERIKSGRFKSLGNFLERIKDKNLNKKSLESLIMCGALDEFGERGEMLSNIENLLQYNKEKSREPANQVSLFGNAANAPDLKLRASTPATVADRLGWEKELLGLYISGHPLDKFRKTLETREINIKKVKEEYKEGMMVVIGGLVEEARNIITKSNEMMTFLRLADFSDSIDVVVFPKTYAEVREKILPEKCIAIKGRVSFRNGGISLVAEKVKELV